MGIFSALSNLFFGSGNNNSSGFSGGQVAPINSQAILPSDRSTPGLFTASDLSRTWEQQGLMLSAEQVEQAKILATEAKKQAGYSAKFSQYIKDLATSESEIVGNFCDAKGFIAGENLKQHKAHNRLYNKLDKVGSGYYLETQKREQQYKELQAKVQMQLNVLQQRQTESRQLAGW